MVNDRNSLLTAIAKTAEAWSDPEYPVRVDAVSKALGASNRFTEEAVAFAINQQMSQLLVSSLHGWLDGKHSSRSYNMAVFLEEKVPFAGLRSWICSIALGHNYTGFYEEFPPVLLDAFCKEALRVSGTGSYRFKKYEGILPDDCVVISVGEEDLALFSDRKGVFRGKRHAISVLNGNETPNDMEGLAEDVLLHEGMGESNVSMLWAPVELNPDPYLEAFALFRGVFPAHERTPGSLQMRKAFLAAQKVPHAYGEGLEFLVSKGDPQFQEPCHIRWVPYEAMADIQKWVSEHYVEIQHIVTHSRMKNMIHTNLPTFSFGESHRLSLESDRNSNELLEFLCSI